MSIDPTAVIAAVPALIGFVPTDSLVLVAFDDDEVKLGVRVDLPDARPDTYHRIAAVLPGNDVDRVVAVIVSAEAASCADDHATIAGELATALGSVSLDGVYLVASLAEGVPWRSVTEPGVTGVQGDPVSSPVSAAAVLSGRRMHGSRDEMTALFVRDPGNALTELPELSVDVAFASMMTGSDSAAGFASLVGRRDWRDVLLALSVTGFDVESLALDMARTLPERYRADALAVVAFAAYVRGDCVLSGVAVEEALELDADHTLVKMVDTALRAGLHPDRIRGIAESTHAKMIESYGLAMPALVSRA